MTASRIFLGNPLYFWPKTSIDAAGLLREQKGELETIIPHGCIRRPNDIAVGAQAYTHWLCTDFQHLADP